MHWIGVSMDTPIQKKKSNKVIQALNINYNWTPQTKALKTIRQRLGPAQKDKG